MTDLRPAPSTRRLVALLAAAQGALFAALGFARHASFHNETFDLAFYARIAWGLAHRDHWEPMVNAHIFGLHLSPVLIPVGMLGRVFGTAEVLIVAQAAALALATFPLARIGARHLGPVGAVVGAIAWLFYPNLGHVGGYEVHPGAIAALPLAWLAFAIDRGDARVLALSVLGVLACREDLALVTALGSLAFALRHRARWLPAALVALGSLAYVSYFFFVLHPRYAPEVGSLELHFGHLGSTPGEVLLHLLTRPLDVVAHLATPARLTYLPKILAPLLFLPLLRPAWLVPTVPLLAMNLLSAWPTTTDLSVQYLTPAIPFLVAGALDGGGRALARAPHLLPGALAGAVLLAHALAGGTPLSRDFPASAMRRDANTDAAEAVVAAIPREASVQAPYPFLSHLAERRALHRGISAEAGADYLILDASVRRRFAGREDLLRTQEEPRLRDWLAREDHALVHAAGDWLLLARGRAPREGLGARAIVGRADPEVGQRIAACLAILGARLAGSQLALDLVARGPCPSDLAVRLGTERRPRRVDLLFGGWLSPRHLARGDRLVSLHRVDEETRARLAREGLRVGAIRQSGARPEHGDPTSVAVPLAP